MRFKQYGASTAFLDLLMNTLLAFVVFFIMAFLSISPPVDPKEQGVNVNAEFLMTLEWDDKSVDDIDLHVRDPNGDVVYFSEREKNFLHLERDDRGAMNDNFFINGQIFSLDHNQEIVTMRGLIPGEYIVNVHLYNNASESPVVANVRLEKLNPRLSMIKATKVTLDTKGQEETAFRFTLLPDGTVTNINTLPLSIIKIYVPPTTGIPFSSGYQGHGESEGD